jgi:hypothetical protein
MSEDSVEARTRDSVRESAHDRNVLLVLKALALAAAAIAFGASMSQLFFR